MDIQKNLHEVYLELKSYATLFSSLDDCDLEASTLYGVGIRLSKLSEKIQQVNDSLPCHLD